MKVKKQHTLHKRGLASWNTYRLPQDTHIYLAFNTSLLLVVDRLYFPNAFTYYVVKVLGEQYTHLTATRAVEVCR